MNEQDVYVVETPHGFTESFDRHTIDVLERLGLIRHMRDDYILQDGSGRGVGPLHRFYGPHDAPAARAGRRSVASRERELAVRYPHLAATQRLAEGFQP